MHLQLLVCATILSLLLQEHILLLRLNPLQEKLYRMFCEVHRRCAHGLQLIAMG